MVFNPRLPSNLLQLMQLVKLIKEFIFKMHDIVLFAPFVYPNINDFFLGVQRVRGVPLIKVNYAFLICAVLVLEEGATQLLWRGPG